MTGFAEAIVKKEEIRLIVCFPYGKVRDRLHGVIGNMEYYSFPKPESITEYSIQTQDRFAEILKEASPDVIHVWGTEFTHTLAMMRAGETMNLLAHTIVSIQGLCYIYAQHYFSNLPHSVVKGYTFKDLVLKDNIQKQMVKFRKRGEFEIEAIEKARHVIGRTTWDFACVSQINPSVRYHFCNEFLREKFYMNRWKLTECTRYSLFASQGNYPIKGLHNVLEAMSIIRQKYPDVQLFVAGSDIMHRSFWIRSYYGQYLRKLVKKYNLESCVTFVGPMDEEKMCAQYLRAHVFVSPSSIENSSNSLGEAMILGVPCVASDVGGTEDMLKDKKEGFLYQHDAPYMLAHYVMSIFSDDHLAIEVSEQARNRARERHDREINLKRMLDIYQTVAGL